MNRSDATPVVAPLPFPSHVHFAALGVALALACIAPPPAHAADAASPQLSAVTVSAGRGTQLQDMDVSVTVMTREEIQRAPQTTVDQLLSRIPGVFVLQQPTGQLHPTAQVFSVRGFGTTTNVNTLLMVDGVPVNDPYFRTIDWGQIPKDSIERIEVIRGGGATSLWGNLAMGGIVNVVTRGPQPGERRVGLSAGSYGTLTLDASATMYASEHVKLGVALALAGSDGYDQTPAAFHNPRMTSTASRADNFMLTAVFTPDAASRYYLKAVAHRSKESGLVWDVTRNQWDQFRLLGGGSTKLAAGGSVNLAGWVGRGEMDTTNAGQSPAYSNLTPATAVPFVSQVERAKYRHFGGSAFWQRDFGEVKDVRVGVDVRGVRADDDLALFSATAQTAAIVARGDHRFQGLFAQGSWRPRGVPLDLTVGLRQDWWQASSASVNGTILPAGSTLSNPVANTVYSRFDPRVGARWFVTPDVTLRGALYRNFAAPGMNQMYRSFVSGSNYTATSPDLKPQTNTGREIGVDWSRAGTELALTAFDNTLENFIDFAPMCTAAAACNPLIAGTGFAAGSITRVNQYVNAGTAKFRGVELIGRAQLSPSVRVHGGATWTDAKLTRSNYTTPETTPPDPVGKQIGQVPPWLLTLGTTWQTSGDLALTAQLKSFPAYWNNTAHTQKNDGATLLDVGAIYRLSRGVELWTSVQNLTNRRYHDQGLTVTTIEGATTSTSSIPALAMPRWVTVGVRAAF